LVFGATRARCETSVAAVADQQQTRPGRCVRANRPVGTNTDANSNPDANDERLGRANAHLQRHPTLHLESGGWRA
jgi:hypothetical protein